VPPPSEKPPCRVLEEDEELPVDRGTSVVELDFEDAPVAGCPSRTRVRTTAKPAAAVRATARFAALARLRPPSTLVPDMPPSSRTGVRSRC